MGLFNLFQRAAAPAPVDAARTEGDEAQAAGLIAQGNALEDAGRLEEALLQYQAAAAAAPTFAKAHLNVGNALLARGEIAAAIDAYQTALRHRPAYAPAHYNLGNAHASRGQQAEAIQYYGQALEHDPSFVDAWVALGNAQDDLGLHHAALESYERALELRPAYPGVLVNLGNVQRQLGALAQAEQACRRALALDPELAQAHAALGKVLQDRNDGTSALASFRRAVATDPHPGAALAQAYHCANQLCDWSRRPQDEQELAALVSRGASGIPPFYLLGLQRPAGDAPLLQRQAAKRYGETTLAGILAAPAMQLKRPAAERLRIGYLSADFHEHATMHLLRGVLAGHDRSKFSIAAYSYGTTADAMTQQARESCDSFRDIGTVSDAQAAQLIAADGIDILVDLKGFTKGARLGIGAYRPAPVLVSWLGYPGSLGLPALADWIIGDPIVTPMANASHFSETLALMPHCYQPNDDRKVIGEPTTRARAGLPADGFVFCSFNQSYKFAPDSFDVWCRLLREVPDSVLWLVPGSPAMAANLQREAAARGVAPDRLVYAPTLALADHLARLSLADLALDTFPYNSHTTGSDALWAGVPLVTRMGDTFSSRVAASLLHAAGLPELVTTDWESYFSLARSLATDRAALTRVRERLAEGRRTAPLFDTSRFTCDLEQLFSRIWAQHVRGTREPIAPGLL